MFLRDFASSIIKQEEQTMKAFGKKGFALSEVPGIVIVLVVVAVVLGLGATILTQVQSTQTANSIAYNASQYGLTGVNTMASWQPTWAVIIAAAVVIGIIAAYLMFGRRE